MSWALTLPVLAPATHTPARTAPVVESTAVDEDQQLMLRVKAGDDEAFNRLMEKHQRTVLNLVYRFTSNAEIAEDLAQEVFLRIYRAAGRYEPRAKFFTYLYQVTLNLCRNEREKAQRRRTLSLEQLGPDENTPMEVVDPDIRADEKLVRADEAAEVQAAIQSLPKEQRELLVLQRFQDLGYEELSQVTGQTVSAVKAKLHRARLALKKKLMAVLGQGVEA